MAAVGGGCGGDDGGEVKAGGPVGSPNVEATGAPVDVSGLVATGAPYAINTGDRTAVLDAVTPIDPPAGLEVVETYVVGPDSDTATPNVVTWPNRRFRDLHPVRGYRLAPEGTAAGRDGIRLVLVMRVPERREYRVRGVWLTYRVGEQRYRQRIRHAFTICGGPGEDPPCEPPPDF